MRLHPCHFALVATCASTLTAQAAWTRLYPAFSPAWRADAAMAFDTARSAVVLFGGQGLGTDYNDLWQWNGATWSLLSTTGMPPLARYSHCLAYDSARQRLVMFGGMPGPQGDTWELAGNQWIQRQLATRPPARDGGAMAFDSRRGVTVMFGGRGNTLLNDTWEWDGQSWQQRNTTRAPAARVNAAMAFDAARAACVLYGGEMSYNGNSYTIGDTWTFDGSNWQMQQPASTPTPAANHAMVFDPRRGRVVMHGGGPNHDPFSWEWDGSNWSYRTDSTPGIQAGHAMAYDPVHRETVLLGTVLQSYSPIGDTWVRRDVRPADYVAYGHGCQGSVGTPALANAQYSWPWLGDNFRAEVSAAPAGATVVLMTGFYAPPPVSLAPFGMPGCDWFVSNDVPGILFANAAGVASWSLRVPNLPSAIGAILFQQAFVLDAVNAAGAVASNAAELHTGVR